MVKVYYTLYDRMLLYKNIAKAFDKVKSADGSSGVDRQTINDFSQNLRENLNMLIGELRSKTYKPLPVRRVVIPKPDGGDRNLGVPAVRDRVVQQTLLDILQPIFEEDFHPSSFGYRPGRSCHQAISKAKMYIRNYALDTVVDMDLSKCFDTLDHEIIMNSNGKRVADGSILNLVRMFLECGVETENGLEETEVGSPQGGVISPLIANIYLNIFDQYMMKHNIRIVRYADDILIFTRRKRKAEKAFKLALDFLENELKLKVNENKTKIVNGGEGVHYLGVVIRSTHIVIQPKKVASFRDKVKRITRKTSPVNVEKLIEELNPLLRGFANYFRVANCKSLFGKLMSWTRRRLRAKQLALWKKSKKLLIKLRQIGYRDLPKSIRVTSWGSSDHPLVKRVLTVAHFADLNLYDMSNVTTGISVSVC